MTGGGCPAISLALLLACGCTRSVERDAGAPVLFEAPVPMRGPVVLGDVSFYFELDPALGAEGGQAVLAPGPGGTAYKLGSHTVEQMPVFRSEESGFVVNGRRFVIPRRSMVYAFLERSGPLQISFRGRTIRLKAEAETTPIIILQSVVERKQARRLTEVRTTQEILSYGECHVVLRGERLEVNGTEVRLPAGRVLELDPGGAHAVR